MYAHLCYKFHILLWLTSIFVLCGTLKLFNHRIKWYFSYHFLLESYYNSIKYFQLFLGMNKYKNNKNTQFTLFKSLHFKGNIKYIIKVLFCNLVLWYRLNKSIKFIIFQKNSFIVNFKSTSVMWEVLIKNVITFLNWLFELFNESIFRYI